MSVTKHHPPPSHIENNHSCRRINTTWKVTTNNEIQNELSLEFQKRSKNFHHYAGNLALRLLLPFLITVQQIFAVKFRKKKSKLTGNTIQTHYLC